MPDTGKHCFDAPARAFFEKVRIDGATRAGLIPNTIASVEGHWSNVDVYLDGPSAVYALGNTCTVFAKQGSTRYPLVTIDLGVVTLVEVGGGQSRALAASVRGHPCDGFEVEVALAAASEVSASLEMWGTESVPDVGGEALADAMRNGRFPQRASHNLLWNAAAGAWERAQTAASGGGAAAVVEQFAPVAEDNVNGVYAVIPKALATNTYSAPQATILNTAVVQTVKAASGNLFALGVHNSGAAAFYVFFVNSAGAPTGASASIIMPLIVPAGAQIYLGDDFFGQWGLFFSVGIGLAAMTTMAGGTLVAGDVWWTARYQ